jgi:hypothetical protein
MTLPKDSAVPRCDTHPVAVITDTVLAVEPTMQRAEVEALVCDVVARRPQQRELARALTAAPDLLTSARPEGPMSVQRLVKTLLSHGAQRVVPPRCARCDNPRHLPSRDGEKRICAPCYVRANIGNQPCSNCGKTRSVAYRDHLGQPLCWSCRPSPQKTGTGEESLEAIVEIVTGIESVLHRDTVVTAVREAIPQLPQLHRTAAALRDAPDLLTGRGAHGSPRVIALIEALIAQGATNIVAPPCSSCGKVTKLRHSLNGLRCCKRCYEAARKEMCSGCGNVREVSLRIEGRPLCSSCSGRQPFQHDECSSCGQHRQIVTRAKGTPLCKTCYMPVVTCSVCKKAKRCHFADTEAPRCPDCRRKINPEPCSRCGRLRPVRVRAADGSAICGPCGVAREACRDCGKVRNVCTRTPSGDPLCNRCYEKTPASFRDCTQCGRHERLFHHGLCNFCARSAMAHDLLADPDGVVPQRLEGLATVLLAGDPLSTLAWLTKRPSTLEMIATLAAGDGPITHEALDGLQPPPAVRHMRAILVAHGVLPERDEHLATLERWLARNLAKITNPEDRRLIQSFVTWHHLRRLRRQSAKKPLTYEQTTQVRRETSTAISLLIWLNKHGQTLGTCTQLHIDTWLDSDRAARPFGRNFILWAVRNRHSGPLKVPARSPAPASSFIDQDDRWRLIRRLLHDDEIDLTDRVAGLLVLLFAQPMSHIVRITPKEIMSSGGKVTITLGREPLELPPPVDVLLLQLRDQPDYNPRADDTTRRWLFPGGSPGTPLTTVQLRKRLQALGIPARQTRNTALRDMAGELPAVVLSKLLGLHIGTATRWSRHTGANQAEYAAELSRRQAFRKF